MYSNFKEQAIKYAKQAINEDNAGNYCRALPLYNNSLDCFLAHLKYEENPKIREAITLKFNEYLRRAEEIGAVLDEVGLGSNRNSAVTTRPLTNTKYGEGSRHGEDLEQSKLQAGLKSVIIRETPNVMWTDVAGLESAKQALQEAVLSIISASLDSLIADPNKCTGKSYLAKAVATEADTTFFNVSASNLVSSWMGESEKLVSSLFQMAHENAPSIIFIDEIDSLCAQHGEGNENEASRCIKTELLGQMQGIGHNDKKVLVLAATSMPSFLDQAIWRQFDKRIHIPLPDTGARQLMFKVHLGDTPHDLNEADFEHLAHKTEGFSGSDISVCVNDALFQPVRKIQGAAFFFKTPDGMWMPCGPTQTDAVQVTMHDLASKGLAAKIIPPPVTRADFEKILARQKPTVGRSDIEAHEKFIKEFGGGEEKEEVEEDPPPVSVQDFKEVLARQKPTVSNSDE